MSRSRKQPYQMNAWPAFTDTMLAFVLVLVLTMAFYVARATNVDTEAIEIIRDDQEEVEALFKKLQVRYQDIKIESDVSIQNITLGEAVLFPSGKHQLKEAGRDVLSALAFTITGRNIQSLAEIQVRGHTDDEPVSAKSLYRDNWDLSTRRALAVVNSLVKSGIDPEQIKLSAAGYGEFDFLQPHNPEGGTPENRRIELRLLYTDVRKQGAR